MIYQIDKNSLIIAKVYTHTHTQRLRIVIAYIFPMSMALKLFRFSTTVFTSKQLPRKHKLNT